MSDTSAGLQEHLVPAVNTLPAAAKALGNVNGLCHSRCSEEGQSTKCSQSPFLLFCTGCWRRSSLNLLSYINVMRLVCLVGNSVGRGVRCVFLPLVD